MRKFLTCFSLIAIAAASALTPAALPDGIGGDPGDARLAPLIIDHRHARLSVPSAWIEQAKQTLHIAYGHTSHGSQITTGMDGLSVWKGSAFSWNFGGTGGALDLRDYYDGFGGLGIADDLGDPDRTAWELATRNYLQHNPSTNVIIWSWCGQVDGTEAQIQLYLDLMSGLERDYPGVAFVYMTGHTNGSALTDNVPMRNQQIRDYCLANNKILYDFADIESYDPDGNYFGDKLVDDACYYDSNGNGVQDRNWAVDWQNIHPGEWYTCESAHTEPLNANLKAYAAWWLWARLAGWDGRPTVRVDFNKDGQEDLLWRYQGAGGFDLVWYLGSTGSTAQLSPTSSLPSAMMPMIVQGSPDPLMGRPSRPDMNRLRGRAFEAARAPVDLEGAMRARSVRLARARILDDPREVALAESYRARSSRAPSRLADPREAVAANFRTVSSDAETSLLAMGARGLAALPSVADQGWGIEGTGDFNGDGFPDLLWRYSGSGGSDLIWTMNRTKVTQLVPLPAVADLNWRIVGTGDFDNDGQVDILWRHMIYGYNLIWYLNAMGVKALAALPTVTDLGWAIVGTGDFNNDGRVDILWRSRGAEGSILVWYLNGVSVDGTASLPTVTDLDWEIAGTGDFDNNGRIDVLWRYAGAGGFNLVWYMDGVNVLSLGALPNVPDLSWRIANR